jgi:hypothetical protein
LEFLFCPFLSFDCFILTPVHVHQTESSLLQRLG